MSKMIEGIINISSKQFSILNFLSMKEITNNSMTFQVLGCFLESDSISKSSKKVNFTFSCERFYVVAFLLSKIKSITFVSCAGS